MKTVITYVRDNWLPVVLGLAVVVLSVLLVLSYTSDRRSTPTSPATTTATDPATGSAATGGSATTAPASTGSSGSTSTTDPASAADPVTVTPPSGSSATPHATNHQNGGTAAVNQSGTQVIVNGNNNAVTFNYGVATKEQVERINGLLASGSISLDVHRQTLAWWNKRTELIAAIAEAEAAGKADEVARLRFDLMRLDHPYAETWGFNSVVQVFTNTNADSQWRTYSLWVKNRFANGNTTLSNEELAARAAFFSDGTPLNRPMSAEHYLRVLFSEFMAPGGVLETFLGPRPHRLETTLFEHR